MSDQQQQLLQQGSNDLPRVAAPEKRVLLPGIDRKGIKADKHPVWYPPQLDEAGGAASAHPLHVLNSFTEKVERFVPQADAAQTTTGGAADATGKEKIADPASRRRVLWYTCGPTVYDVSHMGHARAYLTFDILRRVFEDYFGYDVVQQMNITDIDDKIIKRARIGMLLADYEKQNGGDASKEAQVTKDIDAARIFAKGVLAARRAALSVPLPDGANSRLVDEREEKLRELELKESQFSETAAKIDAAQPDKLIGVATPFLGDWLDHEKGATVTDNAIFDAHARKFEKLFFEDLRALNIREPDIVTRVSEVVPEVVAFVQKIIDNGYAYLPKNVEDPSSIFFDTQKYIADGHDYPKLKPVSDHVRCSGGAATTEDEMAEGEGVLSTGGGNEKRHPNDFALWKFSKPGEPGWDNPWGKRGRPGWHIECSVMASEVLGPSMDIHAGGCDLKFPHHDNELAQSEAYWGHSQWVNYFLHCGHLHIKGLKMSKSLKNFITIRQAMDQQGELKITSREMRLLFLMNDWHRSLNFSDQSVGAARQIERTLRSFFGSVDIVLRGNWLNAPQTYSALDKELMAAWRKETDAVHAALCNNIDTVGAMDALMNLVSAGNKYLNTVSNAAAGQSPNATLVQKVALYITRILRAFGVVNTTDGIGFDEKGGAGSDAVADVRLNTAMDALIMLRDDVRRATREKQLAVQVMGMCDKVRDDVLPVAGIRLEDKPGAGGNTTWKRDDPTVLMRERAERIAAIQAKKVQSLTNQMVTQEKLIAKWEKLAAAPSEFFRGDPAERVKFSQFDATTGLPTHDAAGAALDEKKAGRLKSTQESYAKQHAEFLSKGGSEWLNGKLKKELAEMKAELQAAQSETDESGCSGGAAAAAAAAASA